MSNLVTLKDKQFKPYLDENKIAFAVKNLAKKINTDLENEFPIFLVVLNGSFMFASDLLKEITIPCQISFIKLASYHGTSSTGTVSELIGLSEDLSNRTIVVVEDIVDTGLTMNKLLFQLSTRRPESIQVATMLFKPSALKTPLRIKYCGFEIEDRFVVGYGLDYDGYGRNIDSVYVLAE